MRSRRGISLFLVLGCFAVACSGCATSGGSSCGIPEPPDEAIEELVAEADRSLRNEPLLQPGVFLWSRDVFRACDGWGR